MPVNLQDLPVELLYNIQLFAESENFPLTSRWTRDAFNAAHTSFRAEYLIQRFLSAPNEGRIKGLIGHGLTFRLCSEAVLEALFKEPLHDVSLDIPLPKRLFKYLAPRKDVDTWSDRDAPLPLLRRIYSLTSSIGGPDPRPPDANANDGYALCRAVHASFRPLIVFLLAHGANPGQKGALSVQIAIRKRDVDLVRMLLERDADEGVVEVEPQRSADGERAMDGSISEQGSPSSPVRRSPQKKSGKRRRLEDRIEVTQSMLRLAVQRDARDVVEYFMSKGARPDMATLRLIGQLDLRPQATVS